MGPAQSSNHLSAEPCVLVIFGASGDLTQRKLIPALYDLDRQGRLPKGLCILGVSRTPLSDDAFRDKMGEGAKTFAAQFEPERWKSFAQRIFYHAADAAQPAAMPALNARINALGEQFKILRAGGAPNVLFYLSVSPNLYEPIIDSIGTSGMVLEGNRWCSLNPEETPWQRIIVEKPFGTDLKTTISLNQCLGRVFEEDATYRIDHYLGKELVQNILVMRFANTIFEPLWNRTHIDHIQVTAAETVGVGSRAANFYDGAGALRDMVQSHLMQVLALVAIEPPSVFDAAAIMREKIKLLNSWVAVPEERVHETAVFGRYGAGSTVADVAYTQEQGVDPNKRTETYAAMTLQFDNWRWAGVPFYMRSGKKLAAKVTEIVVQFRKPPTNIFRHLESNAGDRPGNRLIISIAPREKISLRIEGKVPGAGLMIDSAKLDLDYLERFGGEMIEAYGPLILDAMRGDRTLYKHRDEVELGWRICDPMLNNAKLRQGIETYEPGSWGPAGADELLARTGRAWHNAKAPDIRG
jgi:glucose-6-phosphate 1-dehydrogenase